MMFAGPLGALTRYEAETMKVVGGPTHVNPIPILPTSNSMKFWSWGTIAFKPVESGQCKITLRIREDHAGDEFARVTVNNQSFDVIDTSYYFHTDTISIIDSVWISFSNDFPNERNIEIDYVELQALQTVPDTGRVILSWDQNIEPDLAGYKIYYGNASRRYTKTLDVGDTTQFTVYWLPYLEEIFFAATAYDTVLNESGYSNEVSITLIPGPVFEYRKGDWNRDRKISLIDMIEFTRRFGATSENPEYDSVFDFNLDLKISLYDMIEFTKIFGLIY